MSSQPHLQAVTSPFTGQTDSPPTAPSSGDSSTGGVPPNTIPTKPLTKQRAEQALPTDRLSFEKQVQALRSVAQLSGNGRRPVSAEEQSSSLGLKGNVGGLSNRFFKDSGWLESVGRGVYVPTEALVRFHRHLGIQSDDLDGARTILAETVTTSWYWNEIGGSLEGDGIRQSGVLHLLGNAAGAAPNHTPQLVLIIDWLIWLGLIERDGDILKLSGAAPVAPAKDEVSEEQVPVEVAEAPGVSPVDAEAPVEDEPAPAAVKGSAEGLDPALVSFNFSVRITADDATKLSSEQLETLLEFAQKLRG